MINPSSEPFHTEPFGLLLFDSPPHGLKGGMAFAWRPGVDFEMTYVDSNVVNMLMYSDPL